MSVKVAFIGTSWASRVQIPAFQTVGFEVVGVAGTDSANTARVAKKHDVAFHTTDWRDLLDLPCQLLVVSSPPAYHKEQSIATLTAGKHLLCEKPLALHQGEAQEMVAAAAANPEQLSLVDHELRFTPARLKAKELLAKGVLGDILIITARVATNFRIDPTVPWSWWSDASQGGGILAALGSHVVDGVRWLLSGLGLGDLKVCGSVLGRTYDEREAPGGTVFPVTADDIASVTFRCGRAVGTMLVHGASLDDPIDLLTIRGTEGTLVIDRSLKLYYGKRDGVLKEYLTPLPTFVPNRFRASGFAAGTVLLAKAIKGYLEDGNAAALTPAASLADGLAVQIILDEIRRQAADDVTPQTPR
ncbi:MAG: Gfo/Idh/MocA family oxidoreductase [Trueperaceae bacterium]|nr:MAG: Gfo/Idh/MocA family oxidoreductase [Trueperaceae bacterium]